MQNTASNLTSLSAIPSRACSARQSDFRILWKTSIFQRMAYQHSFSTASSWLSTGRSVISFQSDTGAARRLLRLTGVQQGEDERRIAFCLPIGGRTVCDLGVNQPHHEPGGKRSTSIATPAPLPSWSRSSAATGSCRPPPMPRSTIGARDPGPDGMPQVVFNTRSQRAGVVLPALSRMFDDGGEQQRVRLIQAFRRGIEARFETEREPSESRTGGPSCANAVASGPRRDADTSSELRTSRAAPSMACKPLDAGRTASSMCLSER